MQATVFNKIALTWCMLFSICMSGQTYNHKEIYDQMNAYNNNAEYEESILLLEDILSDSKATNYDRYVAYFSKYLTYKRIFSYQDANTNLDLAYEEGMQSDHVEKVKAQVKFEKLILAFDLLQFEEASKLLSQITEYDLTFLEPVSIAYYFIINGTMEITKNNFDKALYYYNRAITLLEDKAPNHLPLIYRKKIDLYRKMNQYDLAISSFEKGLYYAKKYNTDVYILNMYFDLSFFYKEIGDYKNAVLTQEICNVLSKEYDANNAIGRLNIVENQIIEVRNAKIARDRMMDKFFWIGALAIVLIGLLCVLNYLKKVKQKSKEAVLTNTELRNNLIHITEEQDETKNKLEYAAILTARQQDILNLVKQGKTNKEIASILFISDNTVKYHLKNIYEILDVRSRFEI